MKAKPKERISIIHNHRVLILDDIRSAFADIMKDLNACCSSLTMNDLLYCVLIILHCPKEIVMDVMNTTADAIKTRKIELRIKWIRDFLRKYLCLIMCDLYIVCYILGFLCYHCYHVIFCC